MVLTGRQLITAKVCISTLQVPKWITRQHFKTELDRALSFGASFGGIDGGIH